MKNKKIVFAGLVAVFLGLLLAITMSVAEAWVCASTNRCPTPQPVYPTTTTNPPTTTVPETTTTVPVTTVPETTVPEVPATTTTTTTPENATTTNTTTTVPGEVSENPPSITREEPIEPTEPTEAPTELKLAG